MQFTFKKNAFIITSFAWVVIGINACSDKDRPQQISPIVVTEPTQYDTDDPAIWIHPLDPTQSLVVGTDKNEDGALYAFDLEGKIVRKVGGLLRPNNVDIAYNFPLNGVKADIAVLTERETNKIRIYKLPDLQEIDNGGIEVFVGEEKRAPMGIALYTDHNQAIYAIVGRKDGPLDQYLWQYRLASDTLGYITAEVVRKFGKYSGKKEIESIAVDNEPGYVYYSDEGAGVHKYYADPEKGNEELDFFGTEDFTADIEGISIYKSGKETGYILISNQQDDSFNVYPREGNKHNLLARVPLSTSESDGSDVTSVSLGEKFPKGLFVAMSNGKTFQYYDWRAIQEQIDLAAKK